MATDDRQARSAAKPSRRPWFDHITDQKPCLDRFRDPKGWLLQSLEKFKTEHPAAYPFDHSTLCAVNATGHSGPCTCEVVESGQEANRPGDATNAPGHDTEEVTSMPDKRTAYPFRKVVAHRGADDRLECGHTVPAHGLAASKRRCKRCLNA